MSIVVLAGQAAGDVNALISCGVVPLFGCIRIAGAFIASEGISGSTLSAETSHVAALGTVTDTSCAVVPARVVEARAAVLDVYTSSSI